MQKIILSILTVFVFSALVQAQSYEGTITYDKKKNQALLIDYSYSTEAVENAFIQKMDKLGYKPKEEKGIFNKDKGFIVFKNALITDISTDRMDYIIKVEKKGKKDNTSVLYVIMNKSDQNALNQMDAIGLDRAKSFINSMLPDVEAADLELQIKAQEDVLAKAEKKLKGLKDDQTSLEKKLADNKTDQDNTQKDIDNQRQTLGALQGRRKGTL